MKKWMLMLLVCFSLPAFAVVEGYKYQFDSQQDTDRFNKLAEDLRCPKCQNQKLADSNAPVASDMREKVYEMMQSGSSDEQIVDYMVDRYGDFVHYTPPVKSKTIFLWAAPAVVFVIGLLVLVMIRRGQKQAPQPLTEEEKARLNALKNKADKQ